MGENQDVSCRLSSCSQSSILGQNEEIRKFQAALNLFEFLIKYSKLKIRKSGGFKAALKLLEFFLDGNNSRLKLLSGSLIGHCHFSTSVRIKIFDGGDLGDDEVGDVGGIGDNIELAQDCSLSVGLFEQTSPLHLSAANKQLLPKNPNLSSETRKGKT